jgi:hypothetical protein
MEFRRLALAWKRHGPARFVYLVFYNVWYAFMRLIGRRGRAWAHDMDFDRKYGVDTARTIEVGELNVDADAARFARRYQATGVDVIRTVVGVLDIDYRAHTFVDFGSGKGRVLLVAADFPFRRILGVEYSRELHDICLGNIAVYRGDAQRCFDLASVCCDAGAFPLPEGPLVCYFYNPFHRELLARVVELMVEKARRGDPVRAIYVEPEMADLFSPADWIIEKRTPGYAIFRGR